MASTAGSSGSKIPKRKNDAGNRADKGWEHAIDVDGNGRRPQCRYCKKTFSGIFRLKHHLAGTHKDDEPCTIATDEARKQMLVILAENERTSQKRKRAMFSVDSNSDDDVVDLDEVEQRPPKQSSRSGTSGRGTLNELWRSNTSSRGSSQSTLNQILKKELREEGCNQICRFFYTSGIPFNCVKNPEFIKNFDIVARHGLGFKPPTYHEIREKFLKKNLADTEKMIEEYKMEWKKVGCSVMSDSWTDKKRRCICNFLVNSPKGTVFLTSVDTSEISKTKEKIFEMLDGVVEMVGEENMVQVVTDNAANYKAAGQLLMEKRQKLFWTPCAAHCIDLILEDFEKKLQVHQTTIAKAKRITSFIYSRTLLISMLRHFTSKRDLLSPATTRFATAYLTLGCLHELKGPLMNMFTSASWKSCRFASLQEGKKVHQFVLNSRFWKNVNVCLKGVVPLIKVLRLVDSEGTPAMGFIYMEMSRARESIMANFGNVKKRYQPILNIIDARWELQLNQLLHMAAYYLNPRYHYSLDFMVDQDVKLGLYECLRRMVPERDERLKIDLQMDDFKDAKGLFGIEEAVMARETKAPAKWWSSYGDNCPELQRFAIRVLSLTCSSSECERNWSAFDMVHTKRRNRLSHKKMSDLVYVMCNLKLMNKEKPKKNTLPFEFDDFSSSDEWIQEDTGESSRRWMGYPQPQIGEDEIVETNEAEVFSNEILESSAHLEGKDDLDIQFDDDDDSEEEEENDRDPAVEFLDGM